MDVPGNDVHPDQRILLQMGVRVDERGQQLAQRIISMNEGRKEN